jgi:hypothetical protein
VTSSGGNYFYSNSDLLSENGYFERSRLLDSKHEAETRTHLKSLVAYLSAFLGNMFRNPALCHMTPRSSKNVSRGPSDLNCRMVGGAVNATDPRLSWALACCGMSNTKYNVVFITRGIDPGLKGSTAVARTPSHPKSHHHGITNPEGGLTSRPGQPLQARVLPSLGQRAKTSASIGPIEKKAA